MFNKEDINLTTILPSKQLFDPNSLEQHNFQLTKQQTLVGKLATITTKENDTLPDIARHFGLGYNDIVHANPNLDPWLLKAGEQVVLPLHFTVPHIKRDGIVLNLASMRLFHFSKNKMTTYPIGIGREGWSTPTGLTKIVSKTKNPVWRVPASILREHKLKGDPLPRVVKAGKNNPLGQYAMRLSLPSYLIHGTNKPYGVGMQISHGCVRLYPEDIKTLFPKVRINTKVQIIEQPYLLGWEQNKLYLEAHKPLQKPAQFKKALLTRIKKLSARYAVNIDWAKVEKILTRNDGIPTPIAINSAEVQQLTQQAIALRHPNIFYGQPTLPTFKQPSWSLTLEEEDNLYDAQKLAAMLMHQGPSIPARSVEKNGASQVIIGPFKTQKMAKKIQKRILQDFKMYTQINKPQLL